LLHPEKFDKKKQRIRPEIGIGMGEVGLKDTGESAGVLQSQTEEE